jgi:hypothetical protein
MRDQASRDRPGAISRLAQHPVIIIIAITANVLGIGHFLYESFAGVESELTFAVEPGRRVVLSVDQEPALIARYDSLALSGSVSAVRVALWNSGRRTVEGSDVREMLRLRTVPTSPILEASVQSYLNPDITHFTVHDKGFVSGTADVTLDILDPEEGAFIELLFAGPPTVQVVLDGRLKSPGRIAHYINAVGFDSPLKEYFALRDTAGKRRRYLWIYAVFLMGVAVFVDRRMRQERMFGVHVIRAGFWLGVLIVIVLIVKLVWLSRNPIPTAIEDVLFVEGPVT